MNKTRKNTKILSGAVAVAMTLAACGGSDGGDASADNAQTCRIAQRLVDDVADRDVDGVERQLERLEEIDGIDDLTDTSDIADLAEDGGEDAAQDLSDLFDDDLDCVVDVPEVAEVTEAAPGTVPAETTPVTEPVVTEPVATDPPVTEPPATDPPVTEPPATDPPATDSTPASPGEALAVVDIGATGPGVERPELARVPADAVAESGISVLPIPGGEAIAIEYSVGYDIDTFADAPAYSAYEQFTFTAETTMTIEEVRTAFADAIIGSYDMTFESTESSSSRDEVTQSAITLRPDRSREGVPRYEIVAATSSEVPNVVLIEMSASDWREGALPALIPAAAAELDSRATIGDDLGWTLLGWDWAPGVNQFSGDAFTRGGLDWTMGSGPETDIAVNSVELLKVIPVPSYEDIEDDREYYSTDDGNWSLSHSDVYEDAELRASYNYSS